MLFVSYADQNPFQNVPGHSPCFLMNAMSDTSVLVVVVFSSSLVGHHHIGWAAPTYGITDHLSLRKCIGFADLQVDIFLATESAQCYMEL